MIKRLLVFVTGTLVAGLALAEFPPLTNWKAPATFAPATKKSGMTTQSSSLAVPFIALTPCRAYDSRPAHGGAGAIVNNTPSTILLTGNACGVLASGLVAVSVNITVFDIIGATGNGVFKVDTVSPPTVAWINYPPSETQRSNAGAVAVDASSHIVVQVNQGGGSVDFTVDVNGYYADDASTGPADAFVFNVFNAGTFGAMRVSNTDVFDGNVYGLTAVESSTGDGSAAVKGTANGATGVTAGVQGDNSSTTGSARGVLGQILAASPGVNSAAVRGINNGAGFFGVGVWGTQAGTGYGVAGDVFGTTGCCAIGVKGTARSNTDGTHGVEGDAFASSGLVFGVFGSSSSTTAAAAGVLGLDSTGDPGTAAFAATAGVMGRSDNGYGVAGASKQTGEGVYGASVDTTGTAVAGGYLGFSNSLGIEFFGGLAGTGTKSFIEPHPTDPTKLIKYVSIEGREAGVYFRGRGQAHNGLATIDVPEDFRMVASEQGLSIQVTPIGEMANVAVTQIDLDSIAIKTSKDVEFFYTVNGVRKAYPAWNPIQENSKEFVPEGSDAKLPRYLSANETQRLIDNGTYNADGTVNLTTAERAGWTKIWADRKAAAEAAAAKNAASAPLQQGQSQKN